MSDYEDTGHPLVDALAHMKLHLETQSGEWAIREIVTYPKALAERLNPPVIQIELLREEEPELLGVGSGVIPLLHTVGFRIWYFSQLFSAQSRFEDIAEKLSQIRKFLIENPEPDGYGHLYTGGGEMRLAGFNIEIGTIAAGAELYSGGYTEVYLHKILTY